MFLLKGMVTVLEVGCEAGMIGDDRKRDLHREQFPVNERGWNQNLTTLHPGIIEERPGKSRVCNWLV